MEGSVRLSAVLAHWYDPWPLERELNLIDNGVVCVDDFNIGDPRFD